MSFSDLVLPSANITVSSPEKQVSHTFDERQVVESQSEFAVQWRSASHRGHAGVCVPPQSTSVSPLLRFPSEQDGSENNQYVSIL